jgi:transaldolase
MNSGETPVNPLRQLERLGQSIWYDNISRPLLRDGVLSHMVGEGILGVTSNPTIFDKAIAGSTDYDDQIRSCLRARPALAVEQLIQLLMVSDIQAAADILRPVYDRTKGRDGYVSIEVSPRKARDTEATTREARELWGMVNRPNLMIKIPATLEGLPAIEQTIGEGINVNVTLIFSVERYRAVASAYMEGLERRLAGGASVAAVASVASVFVSRVDTLVDDLLQKKRASSGDPTRADELRVLEGKAAVANARLVYQAFKEVLASDRFRRLAARGATVQRPLWGSTGTKNPAYSDLLYVETLVGPDTVNTVPPATLSAIRDHLLPALTIENDLPQARELLRQLDAAGIAISWVTSKLEEEGVRAFEKSFDGLSGNLLEKRAAFTRGRPDPVL